MARQVGLREVYQESCKSKATQISRVAFVVAETSVDKVPLYDWLTRGIEEIFLATNKRLRGAYCLIGIIGTACWQVAYEVTAGVSLR